AFKVLLYRDSHQADLAVGTPIAGRVRPELEALIGFFVNTLVLRTDLTGAPSFAELVARVRATCLDAYAHQDLPFEVVVDALQPERDLSRQPLFQVMFVLQNTPRVTIDLGELAIESFALDLQTAKFDLALTLQETAHGLVGGFEYRTDLFESATIEQMAAHFQTVLAAVVDDPSQRIDRLPLLTESERQRIVIDWNATAAPPPRAPVVHHTIAAQAARTPHAIAVVAADGQLTYAELDCRANQLAHRLQACGIGPDVIVGVCLNASWELIVAILGILKAGGAYLPLDPGYPAERLAVMLADARAPLLIAQRRSLPDLPSPQGEIFWLDSAWESIGTEPTTAPRTSVTPQNLAYLIYTSGSTGWPKGVLISHAHLAHSTQARSDYYRDPIKAFLLLSSVAFDSSVAGIFWTLCQGGTLILPLERDRADPEQLAWLIAQHDVSHLLGLPSLYGLLVEQAPAGQLDSLRVAIVAGEPCPRVLVDRHQRSLPQAALFNEYGPTEGTVWSTVYDCCAPDVPDPVPIGRPIADVTVYVLDAQLQPVPIGVVGDLYIGGAGVARGYHALPDLTAERFVPHPFSTNPGARLYRTGDRARYRPHGTLMFLGRADDQVKLRGYRIELGEIAAVLRQHVAVQEAVVVLRDERLVAYVVENRDTGRPVGRVSSMVREAWKHGDTPDGSEFLGLSSSELRTFLASRLPAYMVPSTVVVLDAFPLTPNGKVDHTALPTPAVEAGRDTALALPRTPAEAVLANIWGAVLGVERVGIHDNFFDLGGHSLLAVRLLAQIQQRIGRPIPLVALLQHPTIAQLAEYIGDSPLEMGWSPLVRLQTQGSERPLFLIHAVGGTVLCYVELARLLGPNQPVYGLQARGVEPEQTPHESLAAMVEEYLVAIRSVQPYGPYRLGGWSFGGVVAYAIASQLRQQGETVELLALIDSSAPTPEVGPRDDLTLFTAFLRDLGGVFDTSLSITAAELAALPNEDRMAAVVERARREGALPELDRDQLQRLAQVFAANLALLPSYQPAPTALPVALLLAETTAQRSDLAEDWRTFTTLICCGVVPGTHYTLLRSPQVQTVADWLGAQLAAPPIIA
ncbi:MAG TPA: amino acid adenylation domain-containing protein, partial [Herpetosiphonaceae bacterium]